MSSTLFGRGTTTQVGAMHRTETLRTEIAEIRKLLTDVSQVPAIVKALGDEVRTMKARLDTLHVPDLAPAVTQEQVDDLESRVEALRVLQSSMGGGVSLTQLQALERRIDAKIKALSHEDNESLKHH